MLNSKKIGFIGGGQMCEAIFAGAISSNLVLPQNIFITDINNTRLDYLKNKYSVNTMANDNGNGVKTIAQNCDIIVLSIKPQFAREAMGDLSKLVNEKQLIISIMGGIQLSFFADDFKKIPLIRVMPNTPMLVGKGVAGISPSIDTTKEYVALAEELFGCVGSTYLLSEAQLDALTAVSGCGPAYVYMFAEAMADGGVEQGLPRAMSLKIAAETLVGAAEMILQTGKHPGELKDNVCSPAGGTIAGVHALENCGFRGAVIDATSASCIRMKEVGKKA